MLDKELASFKGKIISGVFALASRTFILQVITFASTFILTILLSPSVFGIFFVVSAVISFLKYFSDIGLAAALIQNKSEPTRSELVSVFTLQQLLVLTLVAILFIASSKIASFYNLSSDGIFLLHALLIAFFFSSLKTIPSILLERKLEFSLMIIPEILENLTFYVIAIILAFMKMGILSFAWAAMARGLVGLIAIYIISPWPIGIGIRLSSIKHLMSFGVLFQLNSLLALVKDDLLIIYLGKVLPFNQIGYLGWAKKWAEAPLRLIMDSIIRVTFPAFSRIQHEKKILGSAIRKSLFFLSLFIFPATMILVILIRPLIYVIPKYIKWEPAIIAFYLFSISAVLSSFSSPVVNALNALGKIRISLLLMIGWTVLTWVLVPMLTFRIGYNGWAVASMIISLTSFVPIIIMRKFVTFKLLPTIYKPFTFTLVAGLLAFTILQFGRGIGIIFIAAFLSLLTYGLLVFFFLKMEIRPYLPKILRFFQ